MHERMSTESTVVVGRERELSAARSFLDEAARRPAALVLVGEAGIGKTTVWSTIVEQAAADGFTVLVARPAEAEVELAFGVLIDLFAEVGPEVAPDLPAVRRVALDAALRRSEGGAAVDPSSVALAVTDVLVALARMRPVLVAIDDVQWADSASVRALTFAIRRLTDVPAGLVVTMRDGHTVGLTERAGRDGDAYTRLDLTGLDERHLAELVFGRSGRTLTPLQLARIADLSRGNPYYALELATSSDPGDTLPESLAGALRARLATLSPTARAVALTAAALGRFDERLHSTVHRRGLDELRATSVVVIREGVPTFAHPLLASTLLAMHTNVERRAVHASLARALTDPDERALHLGRGAHHASEAVAAELEAAADRLDRRGAPETAALLAERAATLTPVADSEASIRRLLKASDLYQAAGEGSEHVLPLLERLVTSLPAGPDRARVLVRLGWLGAQQGTMTLSASIAYQEQALAESGEAGEATSAAHAVLARLLGNRGDYGAALVHAERASDGNAPTRANLMFPSPTGELGTARFFAGEGVDETLFRAGIELEESLGRPGEPYQSPRLQLALALLYTGRLDDARLLLLELLELSTELGRIRSTAGCLLHLTELELRAGNVPRADAHAREFLRLDGQLRGDLSAEWYPTGAVAVHVGRVEDARRILRAGVEGARASESPIWVAHHLEALGHLELALGNLREARAALHELPTLLRGTGLGEWSVHPFHPDAIEVLVGLGELDEAEGLQSELEEYGRRLDRPWGLATAARSTALIASARGAHEEALAATERALTEHERLEWPLELGRTLLVQGSVLRRLGRRRDAGAALAEARAAFASLRAPLWQARVEAEESRLGGRRPAGGALTPTETRVAELAGQGLRNAEIAARLVVTPKTVEATLSRVYRKLGVRSRTELARRV